MFARLHHEGGLAGTTSVDISTSSGPERSSLELDITQEWTFQEAYSLAIDLEEILAGLDPSGEIGNFIKGLVTFEGGALAEVSGRVSLRLGMGLEYSRSRTPKVVPYIKGNTGLVIAFSVEAEVNFACTIGPFGADVTGIVTVDNLGDLLTISFGLNENINYFLSNKTSLARDGYVAIPSIGDLVDQFDAAIAGQVLGDIELELRVPPPSRAYAHIRFGISDVNLLLDPLKRKSAFSIVYEVEVGLNIPSFIGA